MIERCPSCGAPVRVVSSGGGGTHWYEPLTEAPVLLRTPDGIPDGWYVTVEHDTRNPFPGTVVLHRLEQTPERLRYSERKMYDQAALVRAGLCEPGTLPYQLAEDLLVLLERIARMRESKPSDPLEDTHPMREPGS